MTARQIRFCLAVAAIAVVGAAAVASGGVDAILKYRVEMVHLTRQHILLVVLSGGPAIIVGVLMGIALTRRSLRRFCSPVLQVLNIVTAIPTLAIIALAMMALA